MIVSNKEINQNKTFLKIFYSCRYFSLQIIGDHNPYLYDLYLNFVFFYSKECKTTFEGQKSFYSLEDEPICGPCAGIGEEESI